MAASLDRRTFLKQTGGFSAVTALMGAPLLAQESGCTPGPPPPPPTPVLLGTHTPAAAQSTAWGRRLQELTIFDGQVFVGYGDWSANTGPMQMVGWDIGAGSWATENTLDTECTWLIRRVGDRLVAPFIDRRGSLGDLAVRSLGSPAWTTLKLGNTGAVSWHAFDAATLDGTDLFVAGAKKPTKEGLVWRSPSGLGGDWEQSLVIPSPGGRYVRNTMLAVHGGLLYTGGYHYNGAEPFDPQGLVGQAFDGAVWTDALGFSQAAAGNNQAGHSPHVFDGGIVRRRSWPSTDAAFELLFFDGSSLVVGPETAYDHTVDERGWLWFLAADGKIRWQPNWSSASIEWATAPIGASCIAVDTAAVYVGTATSELYRLTPG